MYKCPSVAEAPQSRAILAKTTITLIAFEEESNAQLECHSSLERLVGLALLAARRPSNLP